MNVLIIGIGGFIGTVARYWLSGFISDRWGASFPWGTFTVNVMGSFLIGFIAAWGSQEGRHIIQPITRDFLMIGILGGYTTFSSFSLQTLNLMREGQWLFATGNIVLSVACCLAAVFAGTAIGKLL